MGTCRIKIAKRDTRLICFSFEKMIIQNFTCLFGAPYGFSARPAVFSVTGSFEGVPYTVQEKRKSNGEYPMLQSSASSGTAVVRKNVVDGRLNPPHFSTPKKDDAIEMFLPHDRFDSFFCPSDLH